MGHLASPMTTMNTNKQAVPRQHREYRSIFTRIIPVAAVVFFVLFSFFPQVGNPVKNLKSLGGVKAPAVSMQELQVSTEFQKYFGGGLVNLAKLE